jgi:DNA-binding transcriptional regulator YhcF (GntR family)
MPTRTLIGEHVTRRPPAGDDADVRISLSSRSMLPESGQVAAALRRRIESGSLGPGVRLPSVRALAGALDLSPNTVAKAYRALEREGLLVPRGRHGTFVTERFPGRSSDEDRRLADAAETFVRRARQLGFDPAAMRRAVDDAVRGASRARAALPSRRTRQRRRGTA